MSPENDEASQELVKLLGDALAHKVSLYAWCCGSTEGEAVCDLIERGLEATDDDATRASIAAGRSDGLRLITK